MFDSETSIRVDFADVTMPEVPTADASILVSLSTKDKCRLENARVSNLVTWPWLGCLVSQVCRSFLQALIFLGGGGGLSRKSDTSASKVSEFIFFKMHHLCFVGCCGISTVSSSLTPDIFIHSHKVEAPRKPVMYCVPRAPSVT